MKKFLLISAILFLIFAVKNNYSQLLLEENFSYPAGDSITQHGWTGHSGSTNMAIVSPGLTYTNYPPSGIGNALKLDTVGVSGMDVNKTFTADSSGSVYASYMVKVLYASTAGDYYFHLGNTVIGSTFRPKLFIKDEGGSVKFGISKGSNTGTFAPANYLYNTTYLIVMKYTFVAGASNDEVSMFVFTSPTVPSTEPGTPTVGPLTDASQSDLGNAGCVAIRQGVNTARPILHIDGIRVTKSWSYIVGVQNITNEVPGAFELKQNYPNPFNPSTTIEFSVKSLSFVTVNVFDALGRIVSSPVNDKLTAGTYKVNFNAASLSSGVYYYKINATDNLGNNFVDTKSMILVK
ncbi:MAG: T9SS C-terminal target domain-containing protein [Ignavibacteriae bacterium]|nr:MAG: T9SS C-terminal target domain-containing protein [Ignavibacteriota bacterium]